MFAKVLLDDSGGRAFDYEVPSGLNAVVGSRVRVPVRMRTLLGTVIAVSETTEAEGVRPISELVGDEPALNAGLIQLANWMADYYCCPLEAAMRTVLPNVIRKAEVGHKVRLFAKLARSFSDEEIAAVEKKSAKQSDVLVALREAGEKAVAVADLCEQCGVAHQTVQSMAKKGWLLVEPEKVERDPFGKEQFVSSGKLELNDEQRTVFARVAAAVDAVAGATTAMKPFLLHGVTGSG